MNAQHLKQSLNCNLLLEIWHAYCELHTKLYELTCEEYRLLLDSNLEELEKALDVKNDLIIEISVTNQTRLDLISDIFPDETIPKANDLCEKLIILGYPDQAKAVQKYNLLLLDIIENIQKQNKRNQFFLNKAIISLNNLRNSFDKKNNVKIYGRNGAAASNVNK